MADVPPRSDVHAHTLSRWADQCYCCQKTFLASQLINAECGETDGEVALCYTCAEQYAVWEEE